MKTDCWQPSAPLENLRRRAGLMHEVRAFFIERDVLEVETPLLARYGVTDPYMDLLQAQNPLGLDDDYYLQSSPEYAMKRLLAAGSGSIFQLAKAFRCGESGSRHNPEFTMLEWYRPGFDDRQLMTEVSDLLQLLLDCPAAQVSSYRQLFLDNLGIDPHTATEAELESLAKEKLDVQLTDMLRDDWLNLLLAELIEPQLGLQAPQFICDYPASQAALAKIVEDADGRPVARRFELYVNGIELANGYLELTDAVELRRRMEADRELCTLKSLSPRACDEYLLAALDHGLPACAGVALGFDRLAMLAIDAARIEQVISFSADRA